MGGVSQPAGTVTLVFTDIEGSTRLLHELGTSAYKEALAEHRRIVREACARYSGYEVDYEGDAFFYAFASAKDAVSAVSEAMEGLKQGPIQVRVGIHTGEPELDPPKYVGMDVHTAARIMSAGHGGQVVVSPTTQALLDDELVSLGSHRLKDLSEPITLYQLHEGSFPPLKTIANTNLPTPASSFLGREAELYQADALLNSTRLLTIAGPGGQGKTRFALELARRAREERFSDYPDGVFSCFLSSLRDPALVLATICQTLNVKEQPGSSALEALSAHLQGKKLLLLCDNLEHLLEAASELSQLLQHTPGLTLLVTSRELLRIRRDELRPSSPGPRRRDRSFLRARQARTLLRDRRALHQARRAPARDRARRRANLHPLPGATARAPLPASRPAQGHPRCRSPPADPQSHDRVVVRPAHP
jgi:class 3 adenylate cyclase